MIPIYNKMPIIFTKDRDWIECAAKDHLKEGSIVLLPEDAILIWKDVDDDKRND